MKNLPVIKYFFKDSYDNLYDLPYDLRFSKIGIQKILKDLHQIEQSIINDISLTCLNFLEQNGAKVNGNIFIVNNERFKFHVEFFNAKRLLLVKFYPILTTKYSNINDIILIDGFGAIKEIEFDFPYAIRKNFVKLMQAVKEQVIFAYLSLQKVFKTNFKSFGEYLFNELYDILNIEINRQHKEYLIGKSYFNVTLRSSKKFRYFFDHENLDILIEYFKTHQTLQYSPIEMLASLISEEASDTLNILIDVEEGNFDHIKASEFISQEHDIKFWASESLLINNKELTSFTIAKLDKIIFQISCPKENEKEFSSVFANSKDSLYTKFSENLKSYIKHSNELIKIPKPTLTTPFRLKLAEWIGTFFGSAIYQFAKKAGK